MATPTAPQTLPDTYFKLVKYFPLARIRDDDHLQGALDVINNLLKKKLDDGSRTYLDALTDFVESYEDKHFGVSVASEADVLREMMRASGLNQASLAKKVNIAQPTISDVLKGKRKLTREQAVRLGRFFNVSRAAFMQA